VDHSEFRITIAPTGASQREISQTNRELFESLGRRLRQAGELKDAKALMLVSDDKSAMDFGATILAALAAPAVIEMVKGIFDFLKTLALENRKLMIVTPDGTKVTLENPTRETLARTFQLIDRH
jgi:hypothetical protein